MIPVETLVAKPLAQGITRSNGDKKSILVFDLDHTLVHTTQPREAGGRGIVDRVLYEFDVLNHRFHVHVRPHAFDLLKYAFSCPNIRVAFWSAGTPDYVHAIVNGLLKLLELPQDAPVAVWTRRETTKRKDGVFVKNLFKMCRALHTDRILLVDDDKSHLCIPGNVNRIRIVPAFWVDCGGRADAALKTILDLMQSMFD